jgi:penicillin-binding protein 2
MNSATDPTERRTVIARDAGHESVPRDVRRLRVVRVLIAVALLGLVAGLAHRHLGRAAESIALERRQTLRRVVEPAPRGMFYDRQHRLLAGNRVRTAAVLHLGRVRDEFARLEGSASGPASAPEAGLPSAHARQVVVQRHLARVDAILGRETPLDLPRLERHFARQRMQPFVLVPDLTADETLRLATALAESDPVQLQQTSQRWYPHHHVAAHVLGRVRWETIHSPEGEDYPILNYLGTVGDWGLEKHYDAQLQGVPGHVVQRVDALGLPVGDPLERAAPVAGDDVVLSLDLDLQMAAEQALAANSGAARGAAVALSVTTGEVLALVSRPGFDLNVVSPVMTRDTQQRLDAEGAWLNRATQGLYPPGSTFKIFTTLAGLRSGQLRPQDSVDCPGYHDVAGQRFHCHRRTGHGTLSLTNALAYSCNVFAYQTGLAAGPEALAEEARRFHWDRPTGLDLPFETSRMLVPDPRWKEASGRGRWTTGDTINLAIGQGFLRISPLQAACAMASLARRETLTVPTLLHQPGRSPSGDRPREPLGLTDADYAALLAALQAGIETGIGRNAQVPGVRLAGKTGTAQVMRPEGPMNVAWMVAFAPVERPEIAVAVAMEGDQPGVEFAGAEHAAPVVREIMGAYFDRQPRSR